MMAQAGKLEARLGLDVPCGRRNPKHSGSRSTLYEQGELSDKHFTSIW
jgi:hypothetical protein